MMNLLPSVLILGLAALGALLLILNRRSLPEMATERRAAARALTLVVVVQSVHFIEETVTGFHERLGSLLGLPGIPLTVFVVLNLVWIVIWLVSIPGLRSSWTAAFFAAWFLAIAGMFNGIAHPLMALAQGGYFPALMSSFFIGIAGVWLWFRLRSATQPRGKSDGAG